MSKTLKISKYTLFIPKDDGTYIVSNTLNGAVVHINEECYLNDIKSLLAKIAYSNTVDFDENNDMHKYFYENGIFIDCNVDEYQLALYSYEQGIVQDSTLNLILMTSRQCNLRCVYCYEDFKNEHMRDEVYESLLAYLKKALGDKLHRAVSLSLFGGEPFYDSIC